MGQDWSWPCVASRKEQEKRLMQSKYAQNPTFEETDSELDVEIKQQDRRQNLDKIQEIIERKTYSAQKIKDSTEADWNPKSSHPLSPAHSTGTQSAFTFTDDSAGDNTELPLVFIVDEIDRVDNFLRKNAMKYGDVIFVFCCLIWARCH